jgi:putative NADH-flavin reductase
MRLTIFGATGGVGRELVAQAIAAGHQVRAVMRRPTAVPESVESRLIDDVTFADAIRAAIADTDVVLSALGQRRRMPSNPWSRITSPIDLNERFAKALVEAIGVGPARPRVIVVSAGGVGDSRAKLGGLVRFMFDHSNIGVAYRDLERMERVLAASNLDWCAVRPTTLNNRKWTGRVRETDRYGLTHSIARADVAWWMLEHLKSDAAASNRTPMITAA